MDLIVPRDISIVVLPARIDAVGAQDVETQFGGLLDGGARKLVADFSGTEYISSAGLRVFLATLKALEKSQGRIILCSLAPFVAEVFEISGFSSLFEIAADPAEAVAALG
jgi:anti-sigma B factor antagonist